MNTGGLDGESPLERPTITPSEVKAEVAVQKEAKAIEETNVAASDKKAEANDAGEEEDNKQPQKQFTMQQPSDHHQEKERDGSQQQQQKSEEQPVPNKSCDDISNSKQTFKMRTKSLFSVIRHPSPKAEVVLRIGLVSLLANILAIAYIPAIVSPYLGFFIGIWGPVYALAFPNLTFTVAGVLPSFYVSYTTAYFAASMLILAASVSKGLFTAVFAIFTFLTTGLYFGPDFDKTAANAARWVCYAGLYGLSYGPKVYPPSEVDGVQFVNTLWTAKGVDNPAAVFPNLLLSLFWSFFCIAIGILLPPSRSYRDGVTRLILPAALTSATKANDWLPEKDEAEDDGILSLVNNITLIKGGDSAGRVIFEPRLCHAPMQVAAPRLKRLMVKTERIVLAMHVFRALHLEAKEKVEEEDHVQKELYLNRVARLDAFFKKSVGVLHACASALKANMDPRLNGRPKNDSLGLLEEFKSSTNAAQQEDSNLPSKLIGKGWYEMKTTELLGDLIDATIDWLDAMHHPEKPSTAKEASQNLRINYLPWITTPLLPWKRFFFTMTLPFRPSRWNRVSLLWSFKHTAGFVVLFAMSVYWTAFSKFSLSTGESSGHVDFDGWQLLTYAYCWKPTKEGTVKIGLQRLLGTATGGFMAWLGIIICSGSYDDDAPINPYGLIAWLTATTVLAGSVAVIQSGGAALMGKGADHGMFGVYFVMTQSLIALEVYMGKGTKGDFVANRVVVNITGVCIAIVVALIPPSTRGGDPVHALKYWNELNEAFVGVLKSVLDENGRDVVSTKEYQETFLDKAVHQRRYTLFLLKDAAQLRALPIFRVPDGLKDQVSTLSINESLLRSFVVLVGNMLRDGAMTRELAADALARHERGLLAINGNDVEEGENDDEPSWEWWGAPGQTRSSVFLALVGAIHFRLVRNKKALEEMPSGYC